MPSLDRRQRSLPREVWGALEEHSLAFHNGFQRGAVSALSSRAQSITLTDICLKVLGEVILKEVVESGVLATEEAPVLPVASARDLIQRTLDPATSHWATFVVFAALLTVWA